MAMTKWGRKESIIWPPHSPIYTYGAAFVALVLTGLFSLLSVHLRQQSPTEVLHAHLHPIERCRSNRNEPPRQLPDAHGGRSRNSTASGDEHRRHGRHDAATRRQAHPARALAACFAARLYDPLPRTGAEIYRHVLECYLRSAVYGSDGLFDLYKLPLLFGLLSLVIQLPFSIAKDVRRRKALRYGRRLKGPEMLTPREFTLRVEGDGIGIKTTEMKTMIRIPERAEAQHMQVIGDTGAGKTMIMLQILRQIKHRGDSAIVYDPAREFVKRFYDPKNGDVILNPLDKRCPSSSRRRTRRVNFSSSPPRRSSPS